MKASRSWIAAGLIAALAFVPISERRAKAVSPGVAVAGIIIIGVSGYFVLRAVIKVMHNVESNRNWQLTNGELAMVMSPDRLADTFALPITFQSTTNILGNVWVDRYYVLLSQYTTNDETWVRGLALTNEDWSGQIEVRQKVNADGWVTLDFTRSSPAALPPLRLALPMGTPSTYFRILQ